MLCYAMLCYANISKNTNYSIAPHQRSCHTIFLMALCNTLIVLTYVLIVNDNARVKLVYAMLCYAMLCYAMLCYAMLCYAMLCYAMLCYAMLCYAMLCYAMLCYA